MFNFQDLRGDITRRDAKNPSPSLGSILSSPPTFYPRLKPPSEEIAEAGGKLFSGETSVATKAGALWDAAVASLGLPQEVATRVLTGGEAGTPAEAFGVQDPLQALFTNILLDPLNLVFAGAGAKKLAAGQVLAQRTFAQIPELKTLRLLSDVSPTGALGQEGLLFQRRIDAERLLQKAGLSLPVVRDEATTLFTYDFSFQADQVMAWDKLRAAKDEFDILEFALDMGDGQILGKPDAAFRLQKSQLVLENLEPGTPHFLMGVMLWGGTPRYQSDIMKATVHTLEDAVEARALYMEQISKEAGEILGEVNLMGHGRSPLARAALYDLLSPTQRDELFAVDTAALEAKEAIGTARYKDLNLKLQLHLSKLLERLPTAEKKRLFPKAVTTVGEQEFNIGEALQLVMPSILKGESVDTVGMLEWIGDYIEQGQKFSKITPNNVDLLDFIRSFHLFVTKKSFIDPEVSRIKKLLGPESHKRATGEGSFKRMSRIEKRYLHAMLNNLLGKPSSTDLVVTYGVSQAADFVRNILLGEDLASEVAAGQKVITDSTHWKDRLALVAERTIARAQRGEPLASEFSVGLRNRVYAGLLGMAVDSAIRNTTQLLNTITELGVGPTLEGIGAQLNPRWRHWLKTENILDRTASQLVAMYEHAAFGQERGKFMDFIMSPMTFAENFNRGVTFTAALNQALRKGQPIALAIDEAVDTTRRLQFGYSLLDTSPFVRDPLIRPFFQFATYPLKQMELMLQWVKEPSSLMERKIVRYVWALGVAEAYAEHLGLSIRDVVLGGFMPTQMFDGGHPQAALYQGMWNTGTTVANTMNYLLGRHVGERDVSPAGITRGLLDAVRMFAPMGRYSLKVGSEALDSGFVDFLFGDRTTKQAVRSHPWFSMLVEDGLRVDFDPGVDGYDRFVRLMGFQTVHEKDRTKFMDFMRGFIRDYRRAIADINTAVAEGGSWEPVRDRWVTEIKFKYGPGMERWGLRDYVVYQQLKPSPPGRIRAKKEGLERPAEQRLLQGMPRILRDPILERLEE